MSMFSTLPTAKTRGLTTHWIKKERGHRNTVSPSIIIYLSLQYTMFTRTFERSQNKYLPDI